MEKKEIFTMEAKRSLSGREKFAYGIGAVGKDMVYMLSASYISIYFLDVMGISAAAIAVLLMAARVFDAFNDPIMGVLVAKTKTRWGKFRPWLLVGTVTNAVVHDPAGIKRCRVSGICVCYLHFVGHDLHDDGYSILEYDSGIYRGWKRERGTVCICTFLRRCRLRTGIDRHSHECCRTWKSIRRNDRQ